MCGRRRGWGSRSLSQGAPSGWVGRRMHGAHGLRCTWGKPPAGLCSTLMFSRDPAVCLLCNHGTSEMGICSLLSRCGRRSPTARLSRGTLLSIPLPFPSHHGQEVRSHGHGSPAHACRRQGRVRWESCWGLYTPSPRVPSVGNLGRFLPTDMVLFSNVIRVSLEA